MNHSQLSFIDWNVVAVCLSSGALLPPNYGHWFRFLVVSQPIRNLGNLHRAECIACWGAGWTSRAIWAKEGTVVMIGQVWLSDAWVYGCGGLLGSMLTATGFHQLLQFQSYPVSTSVEERIYKSRDKANYIRHKAGLQIKVLGIKWSSITYFFRGKARLSQLLMFRFSNGYLKLLLSVLEY